MFVLIKKNYSDPYDCIISNIIISLSKDYLEEHKKDLEAYSELQLKRSIDLHKEQTQIIASYDKENHEPLFFNRGYWIKRFKFADKSMDNLLTKYGFSSLQELYDLEEKYQKIEYEIIEAKEI